MSALTHDSRDSRNTWRAFLLAHSPPKDVLSCWEMYTVKQTANYAAYPNLASSSASSSSSSTPLGFSILIGSTQHSERRLLSSTQARSSCYSSTMPHTVQ